MRKKQRIKTFAKRLVYKLFLDLDVGGKTL